MYLRKQNHASASLLSRNFNSLPHPTPYFLALTCLHRTTFLFEGLVYLGWPHLSPRPAVMRQENCLEFAGPVGKADQVGPTWKVQWDLLLNKPGQPFRFAYFQAGGTEGKHHVDFYSTFAVTKAHPLIYINASQKTVKSILGVSIFIEWNCLRHCRMSHFSASHY